MPRRALLVLILMLAAAGARASDFVAGTEDLPLMPGLVPVDGKSLVFDKPEGRIVEAEARGKLARAKVRDFYQATLPQLGWRAEGRDTWRREGERLSIEFHGSDGNLTVGFTLSPQEERRP
jgi:hypothetical protein